MILRNDATKKGTKNEETKIVRWVVWIVRWHLAELPMQRTRAVLNLNFRGSKTVRALQVLRNDRSASFVSMQRFRGKLGERRGTFVLQGQQIVKNGKIEATWFVVPGSEQMIFLGCAAGAALKTLERVPRNTGLLV